MAEIELPQPKLKGEVSVEEAIERRRSVRSFSSQPIEKEMLSQILWAAQGITGRLWGHKLRAAPSAGALYPMELIVVDTAGVFHYRPGRHSLKELMKGDFREGLCGASLWQDFIEEAPASLVITAVFERVRAKYGRRGTRYTYAEAGHVSQNIYLQCEALGLSTVTVGAFHDEEVQEVLGLPGDFWPIYIMPIGYRR